MVYFPISIGHCCRAIQAMTNDKSKMTIGK
jgi:hypothetical protein